jgi:hypothetical protein
MKRQHCGIRTSTKLLIAVAAGFTSLCLLETPALASFTTVDISGYLNGNLAINDQDDPIGLTTGNTGTGISFETYSYGPNDYMGSAFLAGAASPGTSSTLTIDLSGLNISGQASFYALLNNYFGQPGADEYNVTINFVGGASETYESIGGVDTRDYNQNVSNTIADTTTEWWTNTSQGGDQRLDVREFTIDPAYLGDTIASCEITQLQSGDPAFLSGLTFSNQPAETLVPEPASMAMLGTGVLALAMKRRRRNRGV